ncbi:MAG TPA: hypothetical protein VK826_00415 [Bacteroidia bacterium]|nr:hypothetical protein [Bacteroidia bacterium]
MRQLLFSFLVLCCITANADEFRDTYGNGVIHIEVDSVSQINFYSAPGSKITHRISFLRNAWNIGTHYYHFDTLNAFHTMPQPSWFKTLFCIPSGEYARIDIVAVDSSGDYYRTILKDDSAREVWVKRSKHITFLTWFGFYSQMSSIELPSKEIILFSLPNEKSRQINYTKKMAEDERSSMSPLEVQGSWMKVELQYPDSDPEKPWHIHTGWIQWRDEKQPLIKYNLVGC